jgi:hypothetical protein
MKPGPIHSKKSKPVKTMTSIDTESSIVLSELFYRELKLPRGAHLGGRFLSFSAIPE